MAELDKKTKDAIGSVEIFRFIARWWLLIATCGLVLGLFFTVTSVLRLRRDQQSKSWPTVVATVTDIAYHANSREHTCWATISYRYRVQEQDFSSNLVSLHSDSAQPGSVWETQLFVQRRPKGSNVTAYYAPQNPSVAVLEPGPDLDSYFWILLPGALAFIMAVTGLFSLQTRRLLGYIKCRDTHAIRELTRGKKELSLSLEVVLRAADLPEPEIFARLLPFVGPNDRDMLATYAEHRGTPRMRERLGPAAPKKPSVPPRTVNIPPGLKLVWSVTLWFMAAVLGLVAVAMFYAAYEGPRATRDALTWPSTEGTITRADAVVNRETPESTVPNIEFSYTVAGKAHHSTDLVAPFASTPRLRDQAAVDEFLKRYAPGSRHPVYYDPHYPTQAYLIRTLPVSGWESLAIGVLFCVAVGCLLWWERRRARKTPAPEAAATATADTPLTR